jgi:hypothetical protein
MEKVYILRYRMVEHYYYNEIQDYEADWEDFEMVI